MLFADTNLYIPAVFILVLAVFFFYFRVSYYERTVPQIAFCMIFSGLVGAASVMAANFVLDLMRTPFEITRPGLPLLLAGSFGAMISRLVNTVLRKVNGITMISLHDISEMREQMSYEERISHAVECPFHKEHARLFGVECVHREAYADDLQSDAPEPSRQQERSTV